MKPLGKGHELLLTFRPNVKMFLPKFEKCNNCHGSRTWVTINGYVAMFDFGHPQKL